MKLLFKAIKRLFGLGIVIVLIIFAYNIYQGGKIGNLDVSNLLHHPIKELKAMIVKDQEVREIFNDLKVDGIKLDKDLVAKISEKIEGNSAKVELLKEAAKELLQEKPDYDKVLKKLDKLGIDISKEDLIKLKEE